MRGTMIALFVTAACVTGCQSTSNDDPQRPVNPNINNSNKSNPQETPGMRSSTPPVRPIGVAS